MNESDQNDSRRTKLTTRERIGMGVLFLIGGVAIVAEPLAAIYSALLGSGSITWSDAENWLWLATFAAPVLWLMYQLIYKGDYKDVDSSEISEKEKAKADLDAGNKPISELDISRTQKIHFAVYIAVSCGILLFSAFFG